MRYENFKVTIATGIEMVKRGLNRESINQYFSNRGVNSTDSLLDNFIKESSCLSSDKDSPFPPDMSLVNAIELTEKTKTSKE